MERLFVTPPVEPHEMDVLLVGLTDHLGEMQALIDSAGYRQAGVLVQRRPSPDPRYFVGKGKLEEMKAKVKELGVNAVIFAGTLRPNQHYHLEKALGVQCFDRLRVILEIFTQRAHSREAQLQTELAMLQYEIPILREWIHSAAQGERPGFMAGGEYRVEAFYETVKRKMNKVRRELAAVSRERALRRDQRQGRGFFHVGIAGYANAGKSSLFNVLSGETVLVDSRLFTTLSTTTRALQHVKGRVLLTDTVGLVSDVPLWLVEAFHSTLEEIYVADLVLLLVDASESGSEIEMKVRVAETTLLSGMDATRVQPILTKADAADEGRIDRCTELIQSSAFQRPPLVLSTTTGRGLPELHDLLAREFRYPLEVTVRLTQTDASGAFLNWLHRATEVLSTSYSDGFVEVHLRCRERDLLRIESQASIVAGPTPT